jgi:hypothetical protein
MTKTIPKKRITKMEKKSKKTIPTKIELKTFLF